MPTDRVLVEIITAANMAGVEQAKAGFLGMNVATLALTASLGLLVFAGKAAIDNTEEMDKANRSLSQAADVSKLKFGALKTTFDAWAETNKRYIPDQYAAETALAAFVRTGVGAKVAMRELNVALDFSILRGIALVDAQKNITLAMSGSQRATHLLGISTAEMSHIMKSHHSTAWKHAQILALIEKRTKDGRKATTDLTGSTQSLNKDWQDITTKVGPPLISLFTTVVGWVDKLVKGLDDLGHNKDWNKFLTAAFGNLQEQIKADVQWIENLLGLLGIHVGPQQTATGSGKAGGAGHSPGQGGARASGGSVMAGGAYLVGERGPETLVMGSQGGSIIPNGGGSIIHHHWHIGTLIGADGPGMDRLAREILQRARAMPGM